MWAPAERLQQRRPRWRGPRGPAPRPSREAPPGPPAARAPHTGGGFGALPGWPLPLPIRPAHARSSVCFPRAEPRPCGNPRGPPDHRRPSTPITAQCMGGGAGPGQPPPTPTRTPPAFQPVFVLVAHASAQRQHRARPVPLSALGTQDSGRKPSPEGQGPPATLPPAGAAAAAPALGPGRDGRTDGGAGEGRAPRAGGCPQRGLCSPRPPQAGAAATVPPAGGAGVPRCASRCSLVPGSWGNCFSERKGNRHSQ